ncbi:adenosylcobinamide-phosphate synthase CbiB [Bradyrhizobium sp. Tv2a-2]|uniref:adenosylcobinamide-phosphate synthase CbiB n=1 Tax=Bradyrhizobium sp. Tv2a-2 TaxID=113395 RepID=UPI0004222BD7|nr:adenosylcobinamide-phosphate synthase CbiB [Bradyrhizobium sp. Tv2a-2]
MDFAAAMILAMVIDGVAGWPGALYARIGHPVTWLGRLIGALDHRWNRDGDTFGARRVAGVAAALSVIALASVAAFALQALISPGWLRILLVGILAWPFVALRSLHEHVAAVAKPLQAGDVDGARRAVSMIVGRDPTKLDEAGIARAAIESLAENTSDGVVAPIVWGVLFGLPGIVGYKAINTLDSMIGHRDARHEAFGWAAARIDDVANLVPARLTGLLFAFASSRLPDALACMWRDARHHRSINAGWPEAAVAGALSVRLCGPRVYDGELAKEPWLNEAARDPAGGDVALALKLYGRAMGLFAALLLILALV